MIDTLPLFHRIAGQPIVLLGEGEAAEAKRRLIERAGGIPTTDPSGARLAFIAIEDEAEARAAVERLRGLGLLVNCVDRPALCDFTTPAIVERNPVLIAIGTGGASAGLAKALRLRLEALLPPGLGGLAGALKAARGALRTRWPDAADRRRALDGALAPGGALDPLAADGAQVAAWVAQDGDPAAPAVIEIAIASADPDDLTLRDARWLGQADVLAHEPGVADAVLDRARADAVRCAIAVGAAVPVGGGLTVVLRRAG